MASRFTNPFGGRGSMSRDPFLDLHREVNRLFDDVFRSGGTGGGGGAATMAAPSIDVHEIGDGLEISAELPGVAEKDIDLRLEGDVLTLSGEKHNERKDERAHVVERSYGTFRRTVQLPFAPDPDKVSAACENGVLRIRLPRGTEQERSRKIEIGGGSRGGEPRSAIGGDWSAPSESDTAQGQAERG